MAAVLVAHMATFQIQCSLQNFGVKKEAHTLTPLITQKAKRYVFLSKLTRNLSKGETKFYNTDR